jgi:hypothetical protein
MPGGESGDVQALVDGLFAAAFTAVKASNAIHGGDNSAYLETFPVYAKGREAVAERSLGALRMLEEHLGGNGNEIREDGDTDVADAAFYEPYAELLDSLLDGVDGYVLDERRPAEGGVYKRNVHNKTTQATLTAMLTASKPQTAPGFFSNHAPLDNSRDVPFRVQESKAYLENDGEISSNASSHLTETNPRPMPKALTVDDMRASNGSSGWTWVADVSHLEALGRTLETSSAFAVDLEHHSFRSFQGLTCLMQISTDSGDFIIDCLVPEIRLALGANLGPHFANPAIVKVLHGSNSDVLWMQRDFGIYIVNMVSG